MHNENSLAPANGILDKLTSQVRAKIHALFLEHVNPLPSDKILDVGASATPAFKASNYLEAQSSHLNIAAVGLGNDNPIWQSLYPKVPYTHGNALGLPFADKSFDIVYSHAVIEHVGNYTNQVKLISEALRVAKKSVWITTPNRWHPMEFHTLLPLLHWLPKSWHRFIFKLCGSTYFCKEENLNLLGKKSLILAAKQIIPADAKINLYTVNFLGMPSNLLLHIQLNRI